MITLINPNLVAQRNDLFTTGIVYMPIGLAYFAAVLKKKKYDFKVIDAFGEKPQQIRIKGNYLIRGLKIEEIIRAIGSDCRLIFIYAINTSSHISMIEIIKGLKRHFCNIPIVIIENTQAVTAYSLRGVQQELYENGADFVLTGESEKRGLDLVKALVYGEGRIENIDGLGYKKNGVVYFEEPKEKISNLDDLPFPHWEGFPIENYWRLRYAHGPFETKKYLPILTSRGCPYSCRFCSIPNSNDSKWRSRSARNIVDEIAFFYERFGVNEFHIEDVNPTVSDKRMRDICEEILNRKIKIIWKIVSGTKVETIINEDTVKLMAKAGCNYISISPETGSPRLLKNMNKSFDLEHTINIVKEMRNLKIYSQACFILGFPGENTNDLRLTEKLVKKLAKDGVDEIAFFIIAPIPGSSIFPEFKGYKDISELTFSPTWRKDYTKLNYERLKLYVIFIAYKTIFHFPSIVAQIFRFFRVSFKTKMEMAPYRAWKVENLLNGSVGHAL